MKTLTVPINNSTFVYELTKNEYFLTEAPSLAQGLPSWLVYSFFLFLAGLLGMIFNYKNFLVTMLCVELMYLGAISSFVLYGTVCHDSRGSVYGLLLLVLAACESAVGLGILIVLHRFGRSVEFSAYEELGG